MLGCRIRKFDTGAVGCTNRVCQASAGSSETGNVMTLHLCIYLFIYLLTKWPLPRHRFRLRPRVPPSPPPSPRRPARDVSDAGGTRTTPASGSGRGKGRRSAPPAASGRSPPVLPLVGSTRNAEYSQRQWITECRTTGIRSEKTSFVVVNKQITFRLTAQNEPYLCIISSR